MSEEKNYCKCGCGGIVATGKSFLRGHCNRGKKQTPEVIKRRVLTKEMKRDGVYTFPVSVPCGCGCGQLTKPGKRYIHGHHLRVDNPMKHYDIVERVKDFRRKTNFYEKIVESNREKGIYKRFSRIMREKMLKDNPFKNPDAIRKSVETRKRNGSFEHMVKVNRENGVYTEIAKIQRDKFIKNNPMKDPEVVKKSVKTRTAWYKTEEGQRHLKEKGRKISLTNTDWDFYREYGMTRNSYPYSIIFNTETKQSVRNQWNNRCVVTGITNEEHKLLYGKSLVVHHWNDDKKSNDTYWMVPVCIPVNVMANTDKEAWMALFGGIVEDKLPWYKLMDGDEIS